MGRRNVHACVLALAVTAGPAAFGQIRIVSVNTSNSASGSAGPRSGMDLILSDIGARVSDDPTMPGSAGIVKQPDVLLLQEYNSYATTGAAYASLLNSLYPGSNYQVAQLNGASTGSGTQGMVYNANVVQLVGAIAVGTASTSGQPRQTLRYQLRPVGYGASADLYIYNAHMKASNDSTSEGRRLTEATAIRANADALLDGTNVMYVGDFNVYSASDTAYQKLRSAGNGQAFDPINATWTHTSSSKAVHTQSPWNPSFGGGFTSGGMDDRFDFQLISGELNDRHGLAYIPNSYQAWGNNGTHTTDSSIDTGTGAPATVLHALASILDHLPTVADYQLPAKMSVSLDATPAKVIAASNVQVAARVSNSAPVAYSIGADTLDYALTASGSVSGSAGVMGKQALTPANVHALTLDTATTGNKSGTVAVSSSSQQVANGSFAQAVSYAVVDHANGSFASGSDLDALAIDFGYVPQGFGSRSETFSIANLVATPNFTADLALPATSVSGSPSFTTNVTTFTHLAAGAANAYTATLGTAAAGPQLATHTFAVADEAIPGSAANAAPLTLAMTARVLSSATFPATGFIQLNSGEAYDTGAFSIAGGVTLTKTGPGAMNVTGAQSNGVGSALVINAGAVTLDTDAGAAGAARLSVSTANAGTTLSILANQHLAGLSVGDNTVAAITPGGDKLLVAGGLTVGPLGKLDLNDNNTVVTATAEAVRGYLLTGRAGGNWGGYGIISTAAASNGQHTTGVGYMPASLLGGTFDGEAVDPTDVVLKYAYYGDANLDGKIDADDYGLLDRSFAEHQSDARWIDGDFNYDGVIDSADYLLIDRVYGQQTGGLSPALLAEREAQFGDAYVSQLLASVPEPAGLGLSVAGTLALGGRRRRRR